MGALKRLKEICGFKVAAHTYESGEIEKKTGIVVDTLLKDGDMLPYCGGIKVIHIPGHTRGNISLFLKEKKTIIAGDSLKTEEGKLIPPPEMYCEDTEMARKELRRLLNLDFEKILVSHGNDVYDRGKEKLIALLK